MKIIYHCYGGSHSSVTAAAVHLGLLPTDKIPTQEMLLKIPFFEKQEAHDHGNIRFMGIDEFGNEIYILGRRSLSKLIPNILDGIAGIFGKKDLYFVDVMPYVNWRMVLGGISSRRFGFIKFGRPIVIKGTRNSFWKIVSLVHKVKVLVASDNKIIPK